MPKGKPKSICPLSPDRAVLWHFTHWPDGRLKYKPKPFFSHAKNILDPLPGTRRPSPPADRNIDRDNTPLALYAAAPLSWPEQYHLFRQLHYLRWRIDAWNQCARGSVPARIKADHRLALDVRGQLIESSLRIVRGMTKTAYAPDRSILISDAITILVRSVDLFDPWWGARFSTYAGASIKRSCWQDTARQYRLPEEPIGHHDPEDSHHPGEELESAEYVTAAGDAVRQAISRLPDERMREVIRHRYGVGCERRTLLELGEKYGVVKERIRQIERKATAMLRELLVDFAS